MLRTNNNDNNNSINCYKLPLFQELDISNIKIANNFHDIPKLLSDEQRKCIYKNYMTSRPEEFKTLHKVLYGY